jgi:hypothetical protein
MRRLRFLATTCATVLAGASPALGYLVKPSAARVASSALEQVPISWWELYAKWAPAIQRFPSSYQRLTFDAAQAGNPEALEAMKSRGKYREVQILLGMHERGETIHPRTQRLGEPDLTKEELQLATRIPLELD